MVFPEHKIALKTNGVEYPGFESIKIRRSMLHIAGEMTAPIAPSLLGGTKTASNISNGDTCCVEVNGHPILTGHVDIMGLRYDVRTAKVTMAGRDNTADLVDCSYPGTAQWKNVTLISAIKALVNPFGITVKEGYPAANALYIDPDAHKRIVIDTFKDLTLQIGEKVYETISSLCRQRGVMPLCRGDGNLYLSTVGQAETTDTLYSGDVKGIPGFGHKIQEGDVLDNDRDRYRDYIVLGQSVASDPNLPDVPIAEGTVSAYGTMTDYIFGDRQRPLVIVDKIEGDTKQFQDRAVWEAFTRAGSSRSFTYTINGWLRGDGKPWDINSFVNVWDLLAGFKGKLLIRGLTFTKDPDGIKTTLELVHPSAMKMHSVQDEPDEIMGLFDQKTLGSQGPGDYNLEWLPPSWVP